MSSSWKIPLARAISIIAHPFIVLPLLVFLPQAERDATGALRTALVVGAIIFVPLLILIWRSVSSGEWTTVDASDPADRPRLYSVALPLLLAAAAYFHWMEPRSDLVRGLLVGVLLLVTAAILNRRIKLSLHLASLCFATIILLHHRLAYGLPFLLLIPPLLWSRLTLSRHVLRETLGGAALGTFGAVLHLMMP